MSTQKKSFHFAWVILIGISLVLGLAKGAITNGASLFLTPVSTDLGIGMGNLTLYLSVGAIMTLVMLPFAGKLFEKYDVRLLISIAVILQGGSFAAFGLMNSVWGWYILAIPLAAGTVPITLLLGPILIARWFKTHGGLALGIMGAVAGLLAAIIQPIVGNMIESIGWRMTYISVGLGIIGILLFILFASTPSILFVAAVLFGFISASITTLAPALTTALFGTRDYSRIYSSVSIGLAVASIVALPGYGYVLDFTGSYTPAMIAVIVLLVINMLFVILAFRDKEAHVKKGTWDAPASTEKQA